MRHTKIVATLGPASDSDEVLDELMADGVDFFRLNFSHGTHEAHAATYARLRAAADRAGRIVAVLQDLSGPKIRTGRHAGGTPIALRRGDELSITTGDFEGTPGRVSTTYAPLARAVRPGQDLLLDDGRIVLRVIASDGEEIRTTVVHGTSLGERKGINAPGVTLPATGLAAKDADDVRFGLALGVDMVALSFVQTAADLESARSVMNASGRTGVPLVAKIERPEALDHLDEVLNACDGVMVARGDLGLELPLERVPRVQKDVTRRARARGLPVIVATQVLESMRTEPRPTRAEVSDAANAVDDGVDAIMLAGETAAGAFPGRTVQTLDAIIRDAEAVAPLTVEVTGASAMLAGHGRAICDAAVTLAARGDAHAIVAITREGNTARVLSSLRPAAPIVAATVSPDVARRLSLHWGVQPFVVPMEGDLSTVAQRVGAALLEARLVPPGTTVVFVSVSDDLAQRYSNHLKLHRLT
jgi:pyruvate kinase